MSENVVFQRNKDDGGEWDDSELMHMFQKGLSVAYKTLDEPVPDEVQSIPAVTRDDWKENDTCLAFFKGDQLYYKAEIQEITKNKKGEVIYKVFYTEFDETDQGSYARLRSDEIMSASDSCAEQVTDESTDSMTVEAAAEPAEPAKPEKTKKAEEKPAMDYRIERPKMVKPPPMVEEARVTPSLKQPKQEPELSTNVRNLMDSVGGKPSTSTPKGAKEKTQTAAGGIPAALASFIPPSMPMPPSFLQALSPQGTEDALSNYITSTFMNGYHSGYYQAMKDMEARARSEFK